MTAVLLVAVVVAGCTSSTTKRTAPLPTVTATTSTTSPTSTAQLQSAILVQWLAAEKASVAAAKNLAGPEQDLLVDYSVDPALSFLRTQYAAYAAMV